MDPEETSDNVPPEDVSTNDDQNNTNIEEVGSQNNDQRSKRSGTECEFKSKIPKLIRTKTSGIKWEQKLLSMNMELETRQTRLETQIKALHRFYKAAKIDSAHNGKSLTNWLDEKANMK